MAFLERCRNYRNLVCRKSLRYTAHKFLHSELFNSRLLVETATKISCKISSHDWILHRRPTWLLGTLLMLYLSYCCSYILLFVGKVQDYLMCQIKVPTNSCWGICGNSVVHRLLSRYHNWSAAITGCCRAWYLLHECIALKWQACFSCSANMHA